MTKTNVFIFCICTTFVYSQNNTLSKNSIESNRNQGGIFKFGLVSDNKIYLGYYDTIKYSKNEIENIFELVQFDLFKTYSLKRAYSKAIYPWGTLELFKDFNSVKLNSKEYKALLNKYYENDWFSKDTQRFSKLVILDSLWKKRKDSTIKMLTEMNEKIKCGLAESHNARFIEKYKQTDDCLKFVKLLKSKDSSKRRISLWENMWGNQFQTQKIILGVSGTDDLKNPIVKDRWATFDIYMNIFWENCSGYYDIWEEYNVKQQSGGWRILCNPRYANDFKNVFYKLIEIDN